MALEIMVNKCYGGFGFSEEARLLYLKRKGLRHDLEMYFDDIERHDPVMVQIVKELGPRANGFCAKIEIEKIPLRFGKHYAINDYDGSEGVWINHESYKIDAAKAILRARNLTKAEKIARAFRILDSHVDLL